MDLVENCLVIETEIAIKREMAKLCKIRGHELFRTRLSVIFIFILK